MNPSVKVAQPGWNVNIAPDWALVFSSAWPSLQIAFEQTITITPADDVIFVTHNLNYIPLTFAWITVNGINYGRGGDSVGMSSTQAFLTPQYGFTQDVTVSFRCYNLDITQEAEYPLPVSAAAKAAPDLTTGIKIVKQNPPRNINSPNMNDFILNSRCQSPAVLTVATQTGQYFNTNGSNPGGMQIEYPLQTSYIPWVLGAVSNGDAGEGSTYSIYPPTDLNYNQSSNSLLLEFGDGNAGASLIILRDPLFYPNTVRVVY